MYKPKDEAEAYSIICRKLSSTNPCIAIASSRSLKSGKTDDMDFLCTLCHKINSHGAHCPWALLKLYEAKAEW